MKISSRVCPPFLFLMLMASGLTGSFAKVDEADLPVKISLKVMSLGRGNFEGIYLQAREGEAPVLLSFSPYLRSPPVTYEGSPGLVFFQKEPPPHPGVRPVRRKVAEFALNPDDPIQDLLLFFHPRQNAGTGMDPSFLVLGMDDSLEAFPRDTAIIFNASGATLYGQVNEDVRIFETGASEAFPTSRPFRVSFAIETRDGPKLVFENALEFGEDLRVIIMMRPPRRNRSLRMETYNIIERLPGM